jgi:hypothetical protein
MRSLALAVLLALVAVQPAAAWYGFSLPERYLAYLVRVSRGESTYHLSQRLIDIAGRRAVQISYHFAHDHDLHAMGIPRWCWWGEIIAWTTVNNPADAYRRTTGRWVIAAWKASAPHRAVLYGHWSRWATGMYWRLGRWWAVTVFERC